MKFGDNPYTTLGVPTGAPISVVTKAYRQLAKEWHPDVNESPHAEARFKLIQAAYEKITSGYSMPPDPERKNILWQLWRGQHWSLTKRGNWYTRWHGMSFTVGQWGHHSNKWNIAVEIDGHRSFARDELESFAAAKTYIFSHYIWPKEKGI